MAKKEIISIGGSLGSGKSSTADGVAKVLGWKRFSSGDFMRNIALEKGVTLGELQKIAETDVTIDHKIDDQVRNVGNMEKVVVDSRLAFHWIPESFKVYFDLAPEVAKNRILKDLKNNPLRQRSESSSEPEEIYEKIVRRLESEKKRYHELYGIDHTDHTKFDLVIDTEKYTLEEVVGMVVEAYKKWALN